MSPADLPMSLNDLIAGEATVVRGPDTAKVSGLSADSRNVCKGFLFAALPGSKIDGRTYIDAAIKAGARVILIGHDAPPPAVPAAVSVVAAEDPRHALARIAARFHGGRQPEVVAAVTGTNGKTSTAVFFRQLWSRLGRAAASLGTLGIQGPDWDLPGALTTPDTISLHALLDEAAGRGITHLCMEASSHGLDQRRLDGVLVSAAAFTNLTRDHLDYHGDEAAYFAAKQRLFTEVLVPGGTAVLNGDVPEYAPLAASARAAGRKVLAFGSGDWCDFQLIDRMPETDGQRLVIGIGGAQHFVHLPLAGGFQAANALAALGLVVATGGDLAAALAALSTLEGVPGRLEPVGASKAGAPVYVDFAHTPDALETAIAALRPHCAGKLVLVFGCGGDRDPGKRPLMGAIAARLADRVIVTDDNPRSEDPALVRAAILAACPGATEIGDRARAIATAIAALEAGDLLLIAGKGHESGQKIGTTVLPFDDRLVARAALEEDRR